MRTDRTPTPHGALPDPADEPETDLPDADAIEESADAFASVYAIGNTVYCGLCEQPLEDCGCFQEEETRG